MPPSADWNSPCLDFERAGERAFFVAEQFAFDERGDERSAIDRDKGAVGEGSAEMHGAGHQFFAGSALAVDQDRRARVFEARDHAEDFLNARGDPMMPCDGGFGFGALSQEFVFFDEADFVGHAAQEKAQFFERREGLGDVVVGAELHGLHGGFDGAVSGHQRDFDAGQEAS